MAEISQKLRYALTEKCCSKILQHSEKISVLHPTSFLSLSKDKRATKLPFLNYAGNRFLFEKYMGIVFFKTHFPGGQKRN